MSNKSQNKSIVDVFKGSLKENVHSKIEINNLVTNLIKYGILSENSINKTSSKIFNNIVFYDSFQYEATNTEYKDGGVIHVIMNQDHSVQAYIDRHLIFTLNNNLELSTIIGQDNLKYAILLIAFLNRRYSRLIEDYKKNQSLPLNICESIERITYNEIKDSFDRHNIQLLV